MKKARRNRAMLTEGGEVRLTRNWINSIRAKMARDGEVLAMRLTKSVIGEPIIITCECGREHEAPGTGEPLSPSQVGAAKTVLAKFFPDFAPQDFDRETEKPISLDEQAAAIAQFAAHRPLFRLVARNHRKEAATIRDTLAGVLDNVVPMKAVG